MSDAGVEVGAHLPRASPREHVELERQLLAAIVASSDDAIVSKTLEGRVTSWNAGAERLFGYPAREMIGDSILRIIPSELRGEEDEILARLRRGERIAHYETVRVCANGERRHVSLTISPVRDVRGRVVGASKVARDITPRVLAARERELAERRKDEFLATLSHELRNPMAPIRTAAALLARGTSAEQARWCGEMIGRQTAHMQALLDDLLSIARITRGTFEIERGRVRFGDALDTALEAVRPLADAREHRIHVRATAAEAIVDGDLVRLTQVFSNLLANAVKFSSPGSAIELVARVDADGIEARVLDSGPGIAADLLPRIFEPFVRGDDAMAGRIEGLGLGLALVHRIVDLHGGSVSAANRGDGPGSEFIVRLPVAAMDDAGANGASPLSAAPAGRHGAGGAEREAR